MSNSGIIFETDTKIYDMKDLRIIKERHKIVYIIVTFEIEEYWALYDDVGEEVRLFIKNNLKFVGLYDSITINEEEKTVKVTVYDHIYLLKRNYPIFYQEGEPIIDFGSTSSFNSVVTDFIDELNSTDGITLGYVTENQITGVTTNAYLDAYEYLLWLTQKGVWGYDEHGRVTTNYSNIVETKGIFDLWMDENRKINLGVVGIHQDEDTEGNETIGNVVFDISDYVITKPTVKITDDVTNSVVVYSNTGEGYNKAFASSITDVIGSDNYLLTYKDDLEKINDLTPIEDGRLVTLFGPDPFYISAVPYYGYDNTMFDNVTQMCFSSIPQYNGGNEIYDTYLTLKWKAVHIGTTNYMWSGKGIYFNYYEDGDDYGFYCAFFAIFSDGVDYDYTFWILKKFWDDSESTWTTASIVSVDVTSYIVSHKGSAQWFDDWFLLHVYLEYSSESTRVLIRLSEADGTGFFDESYPNCKLDHTFVPDYGPGGIGLFIRGSPEGSLGYSNETHIREIKGFVPYIPPVKIEGVSYTDYPSMVAQANAILSSIVSGSDNIVLYVEPELYTDNFIDLGSFVKVASSPYIGDQTYRIYKLEYEYDSDDNEVLKITLNNKSDLFLDQIDNMIDKINNLERTVSNLSY